MHRRFSFICFIFAVFLLLNLSEGQWIDELCRNKEDLEKKYSDSALILLPVDILNLENSTWKYRKICLYTETESGQCMQIGVIINGTEYKEFPKTLRIQTDTSRGNALPEISRTRRASKRAANDLPLDYFYGESTCKVPSTLKTAEILCKIFPSSIKCKSYCVYGTTFDEGIVRMHTCSYKQNQWSKEFEECKPFVDCNLKLISPGNLKCTGNEIMKNPYCEVNCAEYEDKAATNRQTYTCMANGKWQPNLPHCVEPKGTDLVKAPAVREHRALTYP